MIKQLALVIIAIVAMLVIAAVRKPDTFRVERSVVINAPAEKIFPLVNDFHNFDRWSPWEKLDPKMSKSITGAASGVGAVYEWSGNGKAGAGRMEITESTPSSRIVIKLDFQKPIEGHNFSEYTFTPEGTGTRVSWVMHGPSPFVSKVMQVFITMDDMIGGDFESGLAAMKAAAEKA